MSFSKKFLYKNYSNILFNNNFIIFCELGSLKTASLTQLKKDFQKEGFFIKKVKNKVFRVLYKNSSLYSLIGGSIFIIYKNNIDADKDLKTLKKLIGLDFILCCLVNNKIYSPSFFYFFKSIKLVINPYSNIFNGLNNILFLKFYYNSIKRIN